MIFIKPDDTKVSVPDINMVPNIGDIVLLTEQGGDKSLFREYVVNAVVWDVKFVKQSSAEPPISSAMLNVILK